MILTASVLAAFTVGLGGSAHCALMCGGISVAMVAGAGRDQTPLLAACAQIGRAFSYVMAGMLLAALSGTVLNTARFEMAHGVMPFLLGLSWMAIALSLLGVKRANAGATWIGAVFWKRLQPLTRRLWPIRTPLRALIAGALWGWLPCGMSYAMLMVAAATGDPWVAAMIMLAFAFGTMPGTLLPAFATTHMQRFSVSTSFRRVAAAAMLGLGVFSMTSAWTGHGAHIGHEQPDAEAHSAHQHQR